MHDDKSIRMYSRSRGGAKRSQGGAKARDSHVSSASKTSLPSSTPGADVTGQTGIEDIESRQIVEKYHREMGVSTFALRAIFRSTKFSEMKNMDKHITSAQLARVGSYSRERRKILDERLDLANLNGMDESLLDFAFTVRPIDTLLEFVDLNQDDVDIRNIRDFLASEEALDDAPLPDDLRLREIVGEYRDLLKGEVDLLSGANHDDKGEQIQTIALHARQCFEKIRSLMAENKFHEVVPRDDTAQTERNESSAEQSEDISGPPRITKQSMEKYKLEHG